MRSARPLRTVVLLVVLTGTVACSRKVMDDSGYSIQKVSRNDVPRANLDDGRPGDHIHVAFGIYICDHFLEPVTDQHPDELGIHTHGDGIVHVHPFSNDAAGANATIRLFFADADIDADSNGGTDLQVGKTHVRDGVTKCSGRPGDLKLAYWGDAEHAANHTPDRFFSAQIGRAPLNRDLSAYTLAFVAKGAAVPPPPSAKTVRKLAKADS